MEPAQTPLFFKVRNNLVVSAKDISAMYVGTLNDQIVTVNGAAYYVPSGTVNKIIHSKQILTIDFVSDDGEA